MQLFVSLGITIFKSKADSSDILFDRNSLFIAKADKKCMQLLDFFKNGATTEEAVIKFGNSVRETIVKLIDMHFLVNNTDDVPHVSEDRSNVNISGFRLILTEKCNLRCKHCYVYKNDKEMSRETLLDSIDKSVEFAANKDFIYHFFGGEPLLRFDLIKLAVERINQYHKEGKIKNPIYRITTNGTLITDEMAKFFAEHSFGVGISLDGWKSLNDKIRIYANGKGTYDDVVRGFEILKKNGVEQAWFLVTAYNELLDKLPEIVQFMCTTFNLAHLTINTPFDSEHIGWTVDGRKFANTLLECIDKSKEMNVEIHSGADQFLFALGKKLPRTHSCVFGENQIRVTVATDGKTSTCTQYWGEKLPKEFILKKDQKKALIGKRDLCKNCIAKNVCGGPCPIHRVLSGQQYDKNKCDFYKELLTQTITHV